MPLWINTAHRLSKWVNTFSFSPPAWCYHDPTCSEYSPLCCLNDILSPWPSSASINVCFSLQMTPNGPPLPPHFAMAPDSRQLTLTHQLPPAAPSWGPSPFTTSTAPPQWRRLKTLERLVSDEWHQPSNELLKACAPRSYILLFIFSFAEVIKMYCHLFI